jgi:hypothetical protein
METNSPTSHPGQEPLPVKKKSGCGCGCFLTGCLLFILLTVVPLIGGGLYLTSLSHEDWGDKIIWLVKNEYFSKGVKQLIKMSENMSENEKKELIKIYEDIVESFDRLPTAQQATVKKDLVIVIKTFIKNPDSKTPPPEFQELLQLMSPGMIDLTAPAEMPLPEPQRQPSNPPTSTSNPYDFGPGTTSPLPQEQPKAPTKDNKFDF